MNEEFRKIQERWSFGDDVLETVIGGKSMLDSEAGMRGFQIRNHAEAEKFINAYGYDFSNPIEQAELLGNFQEAVNFIRKYFLFPENPDGLKIEIPRKISEIFDFRELLVLSSTGGVGSRGDVFQQELRDWACSILKVVHTISHMDRDMRSTYFPDIQKQIFDRFYKVIQRDVDQQLYLGQGPGDLGRVDLIDFQIKPKKSRDSILLKLLHKAENVAEDIFDRVGIRFITKNRIDTFRVVKYLNQSMIVMPANIKPSRSRNTLINVKNVKKELSQFFNSIDGEEKDIEKKLYEQLEFIQEEGGVVNSENPHTSSHYRAIQFTCRQLVKLKNPIYEQMRDLRLFVKTAEKGDEIIKKIDLIDLKYVQRDVRFFYPYEVQVLDQMSAVENEKGRSAHSEYKKAQINAAMLRVMGKLAHVTSV